MSCRLCSWLCDRFCPPEVRDTAIWRASDKWERDFASNWEPAEPGDARRERWDEADGLIKTDPAAALAIHYELAESGSAYSMLMCAWFHSTGRGTVQDDAAAEEFYRRALCAGSWKATLQYAALLFKRGAHDKWPGTLGDGVDKGFIPAFFWLASYRYKVSPSRKTARELRHLLETAAGAGHPGARLILARWMARGRFGLRDVPEGFRMIRMIVRAATESEEADPGDGAPHVPASDGPPAPAACA